ncbi:ABC transporter substrate-binding protein [Actinopolymorpha sp. B9G3]|uniref:ABC transporter substrate-binding protein n=1 Tax=Actinopolymorpha sp. B9G3 TaxID=3158970 RepID=UPI0032D94E1C
MTRRRASEMDRRALLKWTSGTLVGTYLVTGCDLLSTEPTKRDGEGSGRGEAQGKEAPMLAELVKEGKLPPVTERLPRSPAVVSPLEGVGRYGGTIRMATTLAPSSRFMIVSREGLVEWAPGQTQVEPGLAESWEVSEGGKVYTFHLREGARWSDGKPFTADDVMFYYDAILSNKELTPVFPTWLAVGGKPCTIKKVDDHTITFNFPAPHGLLLRQMAFRGAFQGSMLAPKHYLSQFHPDFVPKDELEAKAKDAKFDTWVDYFVDRNSPATNPDRPVMAPWKVETKSGSTSRAVAERNPYYWKVDTSGNQLPYVDRLVEELLDPEVITLRAINGDLDLQFESVPIGDMPLLAESADKGGYRVLRWASDAPWIAMYMNQSTKDPALRALMQNIDFRAGLSHALNRDELNKILYGGAGGTRQPCAVPQDDYFVEGTGERFTEYDVDKANALLDKAGLEARDGQGFRLRPDGETLELLITTFTYEYGGSANATDAYELVKQHWREVGIKAQFERIDRTLWSERVTGNLVDIPGYTVAGILWDVDPVWYVPTSAFTYWAPAYGQWYETGGEAGVEPPEQFRELQRLYDQMVTEIDDEARKELGRQILAAHDENVWMIGTVSTPFTPLIVNADLMNVREEAVLSYRLQFTATTGMEQLAYRNPQETS